jgi:hypothetical protein
MEALVASVKVLFRIFPDSVDENHEHYQGSLFSDRDSNLAPHEWKLEATSVEQTVQSVSAFCVVYVRQILKTDWEMTSMAHERCNEDSPHLLEIRSQLKVWRIRTNRSANVADGGINRYRRNVPEANRSKYRYDYTTRRVTANNCQSYVLPGVVSAGAQKTLQSWNEKRQSLLFVPVIHIRFNRNTLLKFNGRSIVSESMYMSRPSEELTPYVRRCRLSKGNVTFPDDGGGCHRNMSEYRVIFIISY